MRRSSARTAELVGALALTGLLGCSTDVQSVDPRNLDRPSDMAFACFGDRELGDGTMVRSGMPVSVCLSSADDTTEQAPDFYAFVLQSQKGTAALVNLTVNTVLDSDPLVPGKNSIPLGTLPVALVTDPEGCHATVVNAGTCDLSILDITAAVNKRPSVTRLPIRNAAGATFAGIPRDVAGLPLDRGAPDAACPAAPAHPVYVAYPGCHLVAVVDPATGSIAAAVDFSSGAPAITDGNVSCAATCPGQAAAAAMLAGRADAEPAVADAGPPRPVAVRVSQAGDRLFIGAENAPLVAVVGLDPVGLPTGAVTIPLEGSVGVLALADTGPVDLGGTSGTFGGGSSGEASFVYAVATDRTVRVVEVDAGVECDAQVDPRYLVGVRDASRLACLPVGDASTPPRRANERSPGIRMPRDAVPLDIETFAATREIKLGDSELAPESLVGNFALVSTSDGFAYVINVDDDRYPDFEAPDEPAKVTLPLAMAHQLRDSNARRDAPAASCDVATNAALTAAAQGPRAAGGISRFLDNRFVASARAHLLPRPRNLLCTIETQQNVSTGLISELDLAAPAAVRELAWPDVEAVRNEQWQLVWEGPLSRDPRNVAIDGPPVRVGILDGATLIDGSAPFCEIGTEPYDIVGLLGCQLNSQCGLDEQCVFHPDTPTSVNSGLCLPADLATGLLGPCRDVLLSRKQYSVVSAEAGAVELVERRRILQTTPLAGCEDDAMCADLADEEAKLVESDHPVDLGNVTSPFEYVCEEDPSRKPGVKLCVRTCEQDVDCRDRAAAEGDTTTHGDGWVCHAGRCVAGALPPPECTPSLQRYEVRVGEAFAVVGEVTTSSRATGFLHRRIADPSTGICIDDASASPLLQGRIPLRGLPECAGNGVTDIVPNPCLTTIDHYAAGDAYDQACNPIEPTESAETVAAIRFSNPAFTLHLVSPATTGDAVCLTDGAGDLPPYSPVYQGYTLRTTTAGGFTPYFIGIAAAFPSELVRAPDGNVWVIDEGDVNAGVVTRGQLFEIAVREEGFGRRDPIR